MDTLNLALKLMGKEKTTEERNKAVNPSTASIIHMIAVTPSSGGRVVLKDEVSSSTDWSEDDFIEIEEDGAFEAYESDDDPLEDVDDGIVDLTDGDGADIEETDGESVSFSVDDYHAAAVAAYAETMEEAEATEDSLADENASITDDIDDGDATELPDDGETSEEDDLADENATVGEISDDEYTLIDDNSNDVSDDYVEGAEVSDGYTVAECIGSINAGDRVAVMVQNGKVVVLGVVGSGDEQRANTEIAQETADVASEIAELAQQTATEAQASADDAKEDVGTAKEELAQLAFLISSIVTSGSEASILAQTADGGWAFNMSSFTDADEKAKENIEKIISDVSKGEKDISELQTMLNGIGVKTDYINIGTYEGKPCIELGETDSDFKLRITNQEIQFVSGSDIPAYIANTGESSKLMIEQAEIINELQQGGFVWRTRENGNLGLFWKGVS